MIFAKIRDSHQRNRGLRVLPTGSRGAFVKMKNNLAQEVKQYLHAVQRTLVSTEVHKGNIEVNTCLRNHESSKDKTY